VERTYSPKNLTYLVVEDKDLSELCHRVTNLKKEGWYIIGPIQTYKSNPTYIYDNGQLERVLDDNITIYLQTMELRLDKRNTKWKST
jgi:hypothetical protein